MDLRSLEYVAAACGGELRRGSPSTVVRRVCTDSRQVQAEDLFVALAGERFDGHAFLADVIHRGATAVLVDQAHRWEVAGDAGVIAVANTRQALGRLAERYRQDFSLPVMAVGGSNGKTTTKDLIAAVLGQRWATLASEASFNNDIGVPMTLLQLTSGHQAAVLEVGTNHPGELAPLVRWVRPRYGVVPSLGREHLEFFGDMAGVAREEGALAEGVSADGKLFLPGDSDWCGALAERSRATTVRIGVGPGNDWRLRSTRLDSHGTSFRVDAPVADLAGEYRIRLLGRHQALNALFAIALGAELGLRRAEIEAGLAACPPAKMRMQLWDLSGVRVLDDAYNANADSMVAALNTLREFPCRGRRVAVLGDMAELGAHSEPAHEEVGRRAAELGIEQLFAVGRMAPLLARGARAGGLTRVLEFADVVVAAEAVRRFLRTGDVVLLKASRASRLERIADLLRSSQAGQRHLAALCC